MSTHPAGPASALGAREHVSLCEALDRVINKGAVVVGEVTISVADIDLVYLGLQLVLTSIETGRRLGMAGSLADVRRKRAAQEAGG